MAVEIPIEEYGALKNPKFIKQTPLNSEGIYWVYVKSESVLYKIKLKLVLT